MFEGVVLITGVMASGKSTVAQALAERLPRAAHVRGDVFRRMTVSGREDYVPGAGGEGESQLRLRYRLAAATADAYAEAGFTAVVQDVVLGAELPAYVDLIRTRPLHVIVLAPTPATVTAREAGRAKNGYGAWTVEELDRSLRTETPRIGLWLDSSGLTVGETVDAIVEGRERSRVV
ncbi:AAA family ATPase [Streptomyces sp. NBC_00988]|uniref:AAA family ATPase n=1 Tax=Streptomyces sp. NBC_00988 TaxID=2903704 RepID=UPI003865BD46|nr:AAA family ATPase [Streptomyces sp. NBC_00988]